MTTPQEYRKKQKESEETVTLNNGFVCTIRALPTMVLLRMRSQAEASNEDLRDYFDSHLAEVLDEVLPSSVVQPRIGKTREDPSVVSDPDLLYVDEIDFDDLTTLLKRIMTLSGVSEENLQDAKSFLPVPDRSKPGTDSEDLRVPTKQSGRHQE